MHNKNEEALQNLSITYIFIYICLDLNLLQVCDDDDLDEWVSISCIIKKQVYDDVDDDDDLAEWVFCYHALMAGCRSWLKE